MIPKEYPCDTCIHNKVCAVITCFKETEVKTTHPYIMVKLECTEYFKKINEPKKEVAPVQLNEKPKAEKPAKVKRKVVIDIGKAKALRAAGWSYEKIADEFGCATQTIINHMKAYMVKQEKENNGL